MTDRTSLRSQLKQRRQKLTPAFQQQASEKITEKVLALPEYQSAHAIALYFSLPGEVDTSLLIQQASKNKKVYVPVVDFSVEGKMDFVLYSPGDTLKKNRWGIFEPVERSSFIAPAQLDMALVPVLGFDHQGHRLGMGAGYYDRAFAGNAHTFLCGLAFSVQALENVPTKPWDVDMDAVVTEKSVSGFA